MLIEELLNENTETEVWQCPIYDSAHPSHASRDWSLSKKGVIVDSKNERLIGTKDFISKYATKNKVTAEPCKDFKITSLLMQAKHEASGTSFSSSVKKKDIEALSLFWNEDNKKLGFIGCEPYKKVVDGIKVTFIHPSNESNTDLAKSLLSHFNLKKFRLELYDETASYDVLNDPNYKALAAKLKLFPGKGKTTFRFDKGDGDYYRELLVMDNGYVRFDDGRRPWGDIKLRVLSKPVGSSFEEQMKNGFEVARKYADKLGVLN